MLLPPSRASPKWAGLCVIGPILLAAAGGEFPSVQVAQLGGFGGASPRPRTYLCAELGGFARPAPSRTAGVSESQGEGWMLGGRDLPGVAQ